MYADSDTFHFDSYTSAIRQTVAMSYESEHLTLSLSVAGQRRLTVSESVLEAPKMSAITV